MDDVRRPHAVVGKLAPTEVELHRAIRLDALRDAPITTSRTSTCTIDRQSMTAVNDVDHVQITIPRGAETAARNFYCGVLGLVELEKPEALRARGGMWLAVGDRQLHVGVEEDVDRAATKAHVAYSVDDIDVWRARLVAEGIDVIESVEIPGCMRFEFRDPFGNRIELLQRTGAR